MISIDMLQNFSIAVMWIATFANMHGWYRSRHDCKKLEAYSKETLEIMDVYKQEVWKLKKMQRAYKPRL